MASHYCYRCFKKTPRTTKATTGATRTTARTITHEPAKLQTTSLQDFKKNSTPNIRKLNALNVSWDTLLGLLSKGEISRKPFQLSKMASQFAPVLTLAYYIWIWDRAPWNPAPRDRNAELWSDRQFENWWSPYVDRILGPQTFTACSIYKLAWRILICRQK